MIHFPRRRRSPVRAAARLTSPGRLPAARIAAWRWRHLLSFCLVLATIWWMLRLFAPAPVAVNAVVVNTPLTAGAPVAAGDLTTAQLDPAILPADALTEVGQADGEHVAIAAQPGTVLTKSMLVGTVTQDDLPTGYVLVPVTFADRGSMTVAQPGRTVWLYAAGEAGMEKVANKALVVSILPPEAVGPLNTGGQHNSDALVAVPSQEAKVLLEAAAQAPVTAALPAS